MRTLSALFFAFTTLAVHAVAGDPEVLTSSTGQSGDTAVFTPEGSLAADGDLLALGAGRAAVGANDSQGAVIVFRRTAGSWVEEQVLAASTGADADLFGTALGVSGDLIAVGAQRASSNGTNSLREGAVWVFRWDGASWIEEQLVDFGESDDDHFGWSVDVDGDLLVVGAPFWGDSPFFEDHGRAYVYRFDGSDWVLEDTLVGSSTDSGNFGHAVAVDGGRIVVGEPFGFVTGVPKRGVVHAFTFDGSDWVLEQEIQSVEGDFGEGFGSAVALDGSRLAVGDPVHGSAASGLLADQGAAFVFAFDGASWVQEARLLHEGADAQDGFGTQVDLQGDALVVGMPRDLVLGTLFQGSAWMFHRRDGAWDRGIKLTGIIDPLLFSFFGWDVALAADTVAVMRPATLDGQGGAQVMPLLGAAWSSLGETLEGTQDLPAARASGDLASGSPFSLQLDRGEPGAQAWLVVGLSELNTPLKGGVLVPAPDQLVPRTVGAEGCLDLDLVWPTGVPSGTSFALQWWITDLGGPVGFAASNALRGTTP